MKISKKHKVIFALIFTVGFVGFASRDVCACFDTKPAYKYWIEDGLSLVGIEHEFKFNNSAPIINVPSEFKEKYPPPNRESQNK